MANAKSWRLLYQVKRFDDVVGAYSCTSTVMLEDLVNMMQVHLFYVTISQQLENYSIPMFAVVYCVVPLWMR